MSFDVLATEDFERELKRLAKKHRSLRDDIAKLGKALSADPTMGVPIGHGCYKVRMAISSRGKGKSGGARVVTLVWVKEEQVFLLSIYDKSEQDDISDSRLKEIVSNLDPGQH
jgi:mRNA-degrading endonuclease RelE of RelBE toxin-antitoxin system